MDAVTVEEDEPTLDAHALLLVVRDRVGDVVSDALLLVERDRVGEVVSDAEAVGEREMVILGDDDEQRDAEVVTETDAEGRLVSEALEGVGETDSDADPEVRDETEGDRDKDTDGDCEAVFERDTDSVLLEHSVPLSEALKDSVALGDTDTDVLDDSESKDALEEREGRRDMLEHPDADVERDGEMDALELRDTPLLRVPLRLIDEQAEVDRLMLALGQNVRLGDIVTVPHEVPEPEGLVDSLKDAVRDCSAEGEPVCVVVSHVDAHAERLPEGKPVRETVEVSVGVGGGEPVALGQCELVVDRVPEADTLAQAERAVVGLGDLEPLRVRDTELQPDDVRLPLLDDDADLCHEVDADWLGDTVPSCGDGLEDRDGDGLGVLLA